MAIALKKCGVIDAKTYYVYFAQAEQQDILHKEVHEETVVVLAFYMAVGANHETVGLLEDDVLQQRLGVDVL